MRFSPGRPQQENGPYRIDPVTLDLSTNFHSWNNRANMIWLDQPTNTGYSYSHDPNDLGPLTEREIAEDVYEFILEFLRVNAQFEKRDVFLAGESYSGVSGSNSDNGSSSSSKSKSKKTKIATRSQTGRSDSVLLFLDRRRPPRRFVVSFFSSTFFPPWPLASSPATSSTALTRTPTPTTTITATSRLPAGVTFTCAAWPWAIRW